MSEPIETFDFFEARRRMKASPACRITRGDWKPGLRAFYQPAQPPRAKGDVKAGAVIAEPTLMIEDVADGVPPFAWNLTTRDLDADGYFEVGA